MNGNKCPNCKRGVNEKWYYCPMCGADLKREARTELLEEASGP